MTDEIKKLIDDLNSFIYASFWNEANVPPKTKRKVNKQVMKMKKILIKEGLL